MKRPIRPSSKNDLPNASFERNPLKSFLNQRSRVIFNILMMSTLSSLFGSKDIEDLPYDSLPATINRNEIQHVLQKAIKDAVLSVETDFRGSLKREVVSFIAGEVLGVATTQLATSAGILSFGAYSGVASLGVGFAVGVITDWLISSAYDALYDPAGEITRRLNQTLTDLEKLILNGDGKVPGLEGRLRDYAVRRANPEVLPSPPPFVRNVLNSNADFEVH